MKIIKRGWLFMNNLKKLISEKLKMSSKKMKHKKRLKAAADLTIKDKNAHYKEVRSYYKSHKDNNNDKIIDDYKHLFGDRSITEYFENYYKDLDKNLEKYINDNSSLKNKKNLDMDKVFENAVSELASSVNKEVKRLYVMIYQKQLKKKNTLINDFFKKNNNVYKLINSKYKVEQNEVKSIYKHKESLFEEKVEKYIEGEVGNIENPEFKKLAELILGGANRIYRKGALKFSVAEKYYLVGMEVIVNNQKHIITNAQSQYNADVLKICINSALNEVGTKNKQIKGVTKEVIEKWQKKFDEEVFLVRCCIQGMKKFKIIFPKMVDKCALLADEIENEKIKENKEMEKSLAYEEYMNQRRETEE